MKYEVKKYFHSSHSPLPETDRASAVPLPETDRASAVPLPETDRASAVPLPSNLLRMSNFLIVGAIMNNCADVVESVDTHA